MSETSVPVSAQQASDIQPSGTADELKAAVSAENWVEVATLLDRSFFRYLFQAPHVLSDLFVTAPEAFYDAYPRHAMSRAVYSAGMRPIMMVDQYSRTQFVDWASKQEHPLLRDVIVELFASIWEALMLGRYKAAAEASDRVITLLKTQPDDLTGLDDVAPIALVECGVVKLLVDGWDAALVCFREAVQWSAVGKVHAFSAYAQEYLALGYVLCSRHSAAAAILRDQQKHSFRNGPFHRHYGSARILAELFDAIAMLDFDRAEELVMRYTQDGHDGYMQWFGIHARAQIALWRGDPWVSIHTLEEYLQSEAVRTVPDTAIGAVLRADLVSLYQAVGDVHGAAIVLDTPGLRLQHPELLAPRVRQELLCGRLGEALRTLEDGRLGGAMPARASSYGASLHAIIEHTATGSVAEATLHVAAMSMNRQRTYFALFQVPVAVREALRPLLDIEIPDTCAAFEYEAPVRLTARERELLIALSYDKTVDEIASEMHISVNTARTHVRTLYHKLGAHSRDEALWLGRGVLPFTGAASLGS